MSDIVKKSLTVTIDTTLEEGKRRSERVALKLPLKLTARMPDGHRICIEVQTQVADARGGLLDMGIELEPGQRIMLNNNRSSELVSATILRNEKSEPGRFLAAFEFEYPVVQFWPISFPPNKDLSWVD